MSYKKINKLLLLIINLFVMTEVQAQINFNYDVSGNLIRTVYSKPNNLPKPIISIVGDTTLISSSANYYQWSYNNRKVINASLKSYRIKDIGFYRVETSANRKCWVSSDDYPIINIIDQLPDTLTMDVYPNPTQETFNVLVRLKKVTSVMAYVTVTIIGGVRMLQTNRLIFFGDQIRIPVTLNVKGVFNVTVHVNGNQRTKQIIVQ